MSLPIWMTISLACRLGWNLPHSFLEMFGEQMGTVCETIFINCGVTVWNDFVPKHDVTLVTVLNTK